MEGLTEQWIADYQAYLRGTFQKYIPGLSQENLNYLIGPECLPDFIAAVTHETIDLEVNYDVAEYLGDRTIELVFTTVLLGKFPGQSESDYTELFSYYVSNKFQYQLARKIGLDKWIRVYDNMLTYKIESDAFEAFAGTIYIVGDRKRPGLGRNMAWTFLSQIYKDVQIDLTRKKQNPRTIVEQIFTRMGLPRPEEDVQDMGNNYEAKIYFHQKHIPFLASYGVNVDANTPFGIGTSPERKEAIANAYADAEQNLATTGITYDWSIEMKRYLDFVSDPELEKVYNDVMVKAGREGYQYVEFYASNKTQGPRGLAYMLVGVNEQGKKTILAITLANDKKRFFEDSRRRLVREYLNKA